MFYGGGWQNESPLRSRPHLLCIPDKIFGSSLVHGVTPEIAFLFFVFSMTILGPALRVVAASANDL